METLLFCQFLLTQRDGFHTKNEGSNTLCAEIYWISPLTETGMRRFHIVVLLNPP